jgi:hypothetical protein
VSESTAIVPAAAATPHPARNLHARLTDTISALCDQLLPSELTLEQVNALSTRLTERIERFVQVERLPLTDLGKVRLADLAAQIAR